MAAPTLIEYQEAAWGTATTPKDSPSITWADGDVVIVIAGCASSDIPAVPTATGLTFNSQQSLGAGCGVRVSAAVASGAGSSVVNASVTGGDVWGFAVWVWRSSAGIGNSAIIEAQTVSLTPVAANGGICWGSFDFSALGVATITPTPSNTRESTDHGATYTTVVADLIDQTSAGAVSYGTSGGGGDYTVVAIEVRASAAVTAILSGTAVSGGVTEAQIVAGGETIVITLSNDTWIAN